MIPDWLAALLMMLGGMLLAAVGAVWFVRRFISPMYRDDDR